MRHEDVVAERIAQDPEYQRAREARRTQYEFRRALIGARIELGLTQGELARRAGVPRSTITRLESGESNPTVETLQKLAAALDADFLVSSGGISIERHAAFAG